MNKWVQCICNVCGFNPHENDHVKACEVTGQVRTDSVSRARSGSQPLVSLSTQSVVTSPPPPYQAAPLPMRPSIYQEDGTDVQEYLLLSECVTTVPSHDSPCSVLSRMQCAQTEEYYMLEDWKGKGEQVKNQVSTSSESDLSPEVSKQIVGPPPEPRPAANGIAPLLCHDPHNLTPEKDHSGNSYICPRSHSLDSTVEPTYDLPPVSECPSQSPRIFTFDQNRASEPMLTGSVSTVSQQSLHGEGNMPPPRPPKPSNVIMASSEDEKCAYSYPRSQSVGDEALYSLSPPAVTRRSNTISTLDNSQAFRRESCDHPRTTVSNVGNSLESVGDGYSSYMRKKSLLCSSEGELDHTYMTMEPSPALSTATTSSREGTACDSPAEGPYIPMGSPRSHFDFSSQGSQTLPCASPSAVAPRRASSSSLRWAMTPLIDPLPPPVDRHLKPDRKGGKPAPLVIRPVEEGEEMDVPVHSPFTKSYRDEAFFSYYCTSLPTPTDTESGDEKNSSINASPAQPVSTSNSPRPRHVMPHQVEYLDLDLPGSPGSTLQKPAAPSSNISDEKVDYVIVDKNKTLALQNTKEAWQDERQDKR